MVDPRNLTVQISLIRKAEGGISSIAAHPVEHTYETEKGAREVLHSATFNIDGSPVL